MTIGERVFNLLKDRGMTQSELAEASGIPESTISHWKFGANPSSDTIVDLADALDVSVNYLLSGSEAVGRRSRKSDTISISKDSDEAKLLDRYRKLSPIDKAMVDMCVDTLLVGGASAWKKGEKVG